jgi:hypothetical protein
MQHVLQRYRCTDIRTNSVANASTITSTGNRANTDANTGPTCHINLYFNQHVHNYLLNA